MNILKLSNVRTFQMIGKKVPVKWKMLFVLFQGRW